MNTWKSTGIIAATAIAVFITTLVIRYENANANLPRVHKAMDYKDHRTLKVRLSNREVEQIAGQAFYVKPVDTFDWKNNCRGTKGEIVIYEQSNAASGIPVTLCE